MNKPVRMWLRLRPSHISARKIQTRADVQAFLTVREERYRPPTLPFVIPNEGGWTQEPDTDYWYRFMGDVGGQPLGEHMRKHFMSTLPESAARIPFEQASLWRLFSEQHPDKFHDEALSLHFAYRFRWSELGLGIMCHSILYSIPTPRHCTNHYGLV